MRGHILVLLAKFYLCPPSLKNVDECFRYRLQATDQEMEYPFGHLLLRGKADAGSNGQCCSARCEMPHMHGELVLCQL